MKFSRKNYTRHLRDSELILYIDGTINSRHSRSFADHLKQCPACEKRYQEFLLLRNGINSPSLAPSPPRLKEAIQVAHARSSSPGAHISRPDNSSKQDKSHTHTYSRRQYRAKGRGYWATGMAAAILCGGLAGFWYSERELRLPSDPLIQALIPASEEAPSTKAKKTPDAKKEVTPSDISPAINPQYLPPEYNTDSVCDLIPAFSFIPPGVPLKAQRWNASVRGCFLEELLVVLFSRGPRAHAIHQKREKEEQAIMRLPEPRRSATLKKLRKRGFYITPEQYGFQIDPRIKKAYVFELTAHEETFPRILTLIARSSKYCFVHREGKKTFIKHPGIRVIKRGEIYHFVPGR